MTNVCQLVSVAFLAVSTLPASEMQNLDAKLTPYLQKFGLPALSAAVFQEGTVVAAGAVGTRRAGQNLPVTINDRFHLGSDGKAFTSLLVGKFVELGELRWDTPLAQVFPELKPEMDSSFAQVTPEELLSHTSGLTDQTIGDLLNRSYQQEGNMDQVRYLILKEVATKPLDHPRGSKFAYCNLGYMIAGSILERLSHQTWEELVNNQIFPVFDLETGGFGPQSAIGKVDAPLGHRLVDGKPVGMLAGPNGDNPVILGPAGTIHLSVLDFAKWVAWQAGEGKRPPRFVTAETLKKLHTPVVETGERHDAAPGTPKTGSYALGWGQLKMDWAEEPVITHTGSNQLNLAVAMFWPKSDFGFVMLTNVGGQAADQALNKLSEELYRDFSKKAATADR